MMQFIFGDNRSKYDLLYTDAPKRQDAQSVYNKINLPFSPEAGYDVFGYIPLGTNMNSPLFFRCRHDTGITQRGAYYLHGVYHENQPEYFFTDAYVDGMMTRYADQAQYDVLRENADGFSYEVSVEKALIDAPVDAIALDKGKLIEILANVYQKNKFLIVVDDEAFEADYLRLLLKTIFSYLTPSLRKSCSYVTAIPTGGDFMLRIIKRSTYRKDRTIAVDLSAPPSELNIQPLYLNMVSALVDAAPEARTRIFELFEDVYYGKLSAYQRQGFCDFIATCDGSVEGYEKLLTLYLEDRRFDESMGVPRILREELSQCYADASYVESILHFEDFEPLRPLDFYAKNQTALRKIYFLSDRTLALLKEKIAETYAPTIDDKSFRDLKQMKNAVLVNLTEERVMKLQSLIERQYHIVLNNVIAPLSERLKAYDELVAPAAIRESLLPALLAYRSEPMPESLIADNADDAVGRYIAEKAEILKAHNLNIRDAALAESKRQILSHNDKVRQAIRDEKNRREKEAFDKETALYTAKFDEIAALMGQVEKQLKSQSAVKDKKKLAPIDWRDFPYRERLMALREVPERFEEQRAACLLNHLVFCVSADENYFMKKDEVLSVLASQKTTRALAAVSLASYKEEPTAAWIWLPFAVTSASSFKTLFEDLLEIVRTHLTALNDLPPATVKQCADRFKKAMEATTPTLTRDEHADCLLLKTEYEKLTPASFLLQKLKPTLDAYLKKPAFAENAKTTATEKPAPEQADTAETDGETSPEEKKQAAPKKPRKALGWAPVAFFISLALNVILIGILVLLFVLNGGDILPFSSAESTDPPAVSDEAEPSDDADGTTTGDPDGSSAGEPDGSSDPTTT